MRKLLVSILLAGTSVALASAQGGNGRTAWSGTVGDRQIVIDERWTPPFVDSLVTVRVSGPGPTSTIDIPTAGRSPHLVVPSGADRLVVIAAEMASIVDLSKELVVDQFLVERPSVSPTGTFLAYWRYQPRSSKDEDMLLVYDVGSSGALNRLPPSGGTMDAMRDVGLPVFPVWYTANQRYRGRNQTAGAPGEAPRSPIVWANDTDFVFLAGRGSAGPDASLALHHAHVRGGGQPPVLRSRALDAKALIDPVGSSTGSGSGAPILQASDIEILACAGSTCQAQIEWVPLPGLREPSLRVTF